MPKLEGEKGKGRNKITADYKYIRIKMVRKTLRIMELKEIYKRNHEGQGIKKICREMGLVQSTVRSAINRIDIYINHILTGTLKNKKSPRKAYISTARWAIKAYKISYEKKPVVGKAEEYQAQPSKPGEIVLTLTDDVPTLSDRFDDLNNAFETFTESIGQFVEAQVKIKNTKLIKENAELREVVETAKHSNWISNLKKRLE